MGSEMCIRDRVEQFYERVKASGDIVVGKQTGWYCVDCEEYKDDPAEAESPSCPIHRKPLEWRDEENLFFRLSRYQSAIEELVARDDFIALPADARKCAISSPKACATSPFHG